jgi:hypothetical protein
MPPAPLLAHPHDEIAHLPRLGLCGIHLDVAASQAVLRAHAHPPQPVMGGQPQIVVPDPDDAALFDSPSSLSASTDSLATPVDRDAHYWTVHNRDDESWQRALSFATRGEGELPKSPGLSVLLCVGLLVKTGGRADASRRASLEELPADYA